ncbi:MAG: sulfur carrier protein ThiS, partial [Novosphingobium sp.]
NKQWPAERTQPDHPITTRERVEHGAAEIAQSFEMTNGDAVEVIYRLVADDPALQIEAVVTKTPLAEPHGLYLPMPTTLGSGWEVDYETAGTTVRLDEEQLPFASRHYVTTQRFIRIADAERIFARHGLAPKAGTGSEKFHSALFCRATGFPVPLEFMAGFSVFSDDEWVPVVPNPAHDVAIGAARLWLPSIADLVVSLDLDPKKVAVEHNAEIAPRSMLAAIALADGDVLEIVHFVGGG